jgi:DUF4097 and DUF4098 domain-containing protein YvlB
MKTFIVAAPHRRPIARVTALLVMALPLAALAGTPISKRTEADPAGTVEISNTAGSVLVTGWDRNEVEVTGELGKGTERLDFTQDDKVTRIKVVLPERASNVDETDLVVKVPVGSLVSVNTVSADIGVQAVRGTQRLQSVSGDLRTETSGEDLECRTVSGDVTIAGSGRKGLVSITSGDFTLAVGATSRSRLRSTSGNLTLQGSLAPDARVDIESISGDVRLDLVGKTGADYDVASFSGEIRPCFGPKPVRTDEYAPGKEWRHQEGDGSARVRIKTLSGDVDVCSR